MGEDCNCGFYVISSPLSSSELTWNPSLRGPSLDIILFEGSIHAGHQAYPAHKKCTERTGEGEHEVVRTLPYEKAAYDKK